MTEEEWLTNTSSVAMMRHLNADGNSRKSLLYAVAVCMREPERLTETLREWVEVAERYLEGRMGNRALETATVGAGIESQHLAETRQGRTRAQYVAIRNAVCCA